LYKKLDYTTGSKNGNSSISTQNKQTHVEIHLEPFLNFLRMVWHNSVKTACTFFVFF